MIKMIIKAIYSAFISFLLILVVLSVWTTYSFIFQSSKSNEISKVIEDIYVSQKSVVFDVIELSKILIKDTSEKRTNENDNVSLEPELLADQEEDSQLYQLPSTEDNGDKPLGIVIHPSLDKISENNLSEIREQPLVDEPNDSPMIKMEMN